MDAIGDKYDNGRGEHVMREFAGMLFGAAAEAHEEVASFSVCCTLSHFACNW